MALMHTPVCNFGEAAKPFQLKGIDGKSYTLEDARGPAGTLVMFICNHCPYVKSIVDRLVRDAEALQAKGIGVIAVMSNDAEAYPEDSFENMQKFAEKNGFTFPYVIDEMQEVAKAYDAVCTPDFFGYNKDMELQYRGRLDESEKEPAASNATRELYDAMSQVAETGHGPQDQTPSMGCSIKWKQEKAA